MINTLLIYIVNTGLLTSIVAVAAVVTSIVMPNNFIFVSIYFVISELYSNSMLTSLNARQRLRKHSVASSHHHDDQFTSLRFAPGEASTTTGVKSTSTFFTDAGR
ncbi:hypothetical protein PHLGIDRAFT_328316 [Phlebiopsis gigantea 11061_1 CR5-6]|uniref:DUF6534 domain-containing protein n=1 Tax=Phlebiopsis gigantea (strain 11061_1 CR5-6) TaxID=745531 RepID=A0A0C3SFK9_PHLG1|nr:hypothetical protein PHLGIDRAFT_328316 [Phlebiopsis gigantea 11061_1 CR5-6]